MNVPKRTPILFYTPYGLAKSLILELRRQKLISSKHSDVSLKRERNRDLIFVPRCLPPSIPLAIAEAVFEVPAFGRFKISKSLTDQYATHLREWAQAMKIEAIRIVVFCTGSRFVRQDLLRFMSRELGSRGVVFSDNPNLPAAWIVAVDEFFYLCVPPKDPSAWVVDRSRNRQERDGSLPGEIAGAMIFHANIKSGDTVWDPTCGSGTILAEAQRFCADLKLIGSDSDPVAIQIAKKNVSQAVFFAKSIFDIETPKGVSHIIANLPFGQKHQAHGGLSNLYIEVCRRFAESPSCKMGRLVLLSSSRELLISSIQAVGKLEVEKMISLQAKGLKCTIVVARVGG